MHPRAYWLCTSNYLTTGMKKVSAKYFSSALTLSRAGSDRRQRKQMRDEFEQHGGSKKRFKREDTRSPGEGVFKKK